MEFKKGQLVQLGKNGPIGIVVSHQSQRALNALLFKVMVFRNGGAHPEHWSVHALKPLETQNNGV